MNTANILSVNYGAYNAIRMLIGVYHAAFLISTGVTISQLAVLQIVFSVTVLILDFPLSVIADRFYRKQVVVSGVFFTILFSLLICWHWFFLKYFMPLVFVVYLGL